MIWQYKSVHFNCANFVKGSISLVYSLKYTLVCNEKIRTRSLFLNIFWMHPCSFFSFFFKACSPAFIKNVVSRLSICDFSVKDAISLNGDFSVKRYQINPKIKFATFESVLMMIKLKLITKNFKRPN